MDDFPGLTLDGDDDVMRISEDDDGMPSLSERPSKRAVVQVDAGEPGSTVEADAQEELSEVLQGFKSRAEREDQRFWDAVDSEYWIAVCFQTREQKEEFLTKLKLLDIGDKYLDGMKVAKALGIKLESRVPVPPTPRPFDQEYIRMADDI